MIESKKIDWKPYLSLKLTVSNVIHGFIVRSMTVLYLAQLGLLLIFPVNLSQIFKHVIHLNSKKSRSLTIQSFNKNDDVTVHSHITCIRRIEGFDVIDFMDTTRYCWEKKDVPHSRAIGRQQLFVAIAAERHFITITVPSNGK